MSTKLYRSFSRIRAYLLATIASLFCFTCYNSENDTPSDTGSDTSGDLDTDTDLDTNTDTDTVSDIDTGSDTSPHMGKYLSDIMGVGPNDIYAAGSEGLLLHFDGNEWLEIDLSVEDYLNAVWTVATDLVFVGGVIDSKGSGRGVIHQFDGKKWQVVFEREKDNSQIESIWGSSPNDIYAVGGYHNPSPANVGQSGINHFDGQSWATVLESEIVEVCDVGFHNIEKIWGFTNGNLYMTYFYSSAGYPYYELFFYPNYMEETCSSFEEFGYPDFIYDIWGSSPDNLLVATENGQLHQFDGFSWQEVYAIADNIIHSIWGLHENDIFAVGTFGSIAHYDGASWNLMETNIKGNLRGVWGTKEAIYAVGDSNNDLPTSERSPAVYRYAGDNWTRVY